MSSIHSQALNDGLQHIRELSDPLLAGLRRLVEMGADRDLLHVNPVEFARAGTAARTPPAGA